jgi:hypothetical protein
MFYRLNDTIESFFDYENLYSHRFHMLLDESKQSRNKVELYDSEAKKAFMWDRISLADQPFREVKQYFDMDPYPQDFISTLYYIRMIPLETGKIYDFNIMSDGKASRTAVYVERREKLNTIFGEVDAIVIRPEPNFTGVLRRDGDSFMWLTDDDRKILLKVEAKVKVGKILGVLEKAEFGDAQTAQ